MQLIRLSLLGVVPVATASSNPIASILALAARSNNSSIGTANNPVGLPGNMDGASPMPRGQQQNPMQGAIQRRMKKHK